MMSMQTAGAFSHAYTSLLQPVVHVKLCVKQSRVTKVLMPSAKSHTLSAETILDLFATEACH